MCCVCVVVDLFCLAEAVRGGASKVKVDKRVESTNDSGAGQINGRKVIEDEVRWS